MAQQQNLTAEALQRGAIPGRGYALARWISQVFHPVTLSIINLFIVGTFALPHRLAGLGWAVLCVALQILPGMAFFTIRLRQGVYTDEDVSVRHQRNELYFFSMGIIVVGMAVLIVLGAPDAFLALLCSAAVMNVLSWSINLFWKISVHAASMATCATIAAIYSQPLGVLMWLCTLLVGWSRVRTRNHTPMQVIAGVGLAVASIWGVFAVFGLV